LWANVLEGDNCAICSWVWWIGVSEGFTVFGCHIFDLIE
jgi:hypothetical protein